MVFGFTADNISKDTRNRAQGAARDFAQNQFGRSRGASGNQQMSEGRNDPLSQQQQGFSSSDTHRQQSQTRSSNVDPYQESSVGLSGNDSYSADPQQQSYHGGTNFEGVPQDTSYNPQSNVSSTTGRGASGYQSQGVDQYSSGNRGYGSNYEQETAGYDDSAQRSGHSQGISGVSGSDRYDTMGGDTDFSSTANDTRGSGWQQTSGDRDYDSYNNPTSRSGFQQQSPSSAGYGPSSGGDFQQQTQTHPLSSQDYSGANVDSNRYDNYNTASQGRYDSSQGVGEGTQSSQYGTQQGYGSADAAQQGRRASFGEKIKGAAMQAAGALRGDTQKKVAGEQIRKFGGNVGQQAGTGPFK
ncbi:hypothetical protein IWQ62_003245 [Dispira parvispora]|uniref:Uncharacterized protein n=1 Tax=Dispira parvispora TaxID=1520584 RepID=A0A9W8AUC5_9FUNG|nr:hypothetical protein IWQ62_003245 [Dispira parvispora]